MCQVIAGDYICICADEYQGQNCGMYLLQLVFDTNKLKLFISEIGPTPSPSSSPTDDSTVPTVTTTSVNSVAIIVSSVVMFIICVIVLATVTVFCYRKMRKQTDGPTTTEDDNWSFGHSHKPLSNFYDNPDEYSEIGHSHKPLSNLYEDLDEYFEMECRNIQQDKR